VFIISIAVQIISLTSLLNEPTLNFLWIAFTQIHADFYVYSDEKSQ